MQFSVAIRKNPFAKLLLFYIAGILLATWYHAPNYFMLFVTPFSLIAVTLILLIVIIRTPGFNTHWISGMTAGFAIFIIGFVNMNIHWYSGERLKASTGTTSTVMVEITEPPVITPKSVKTEGRILFLEVKGKLEKHNEKILLTIRKDSSSLALFPGDKIIAPIRLNRISPAGNPDEFDYQEYMATRGIYNQAYVRAGSWKLVHGLKRFTPKIFACKLQQQLLNKYKKIGLNNTLYSLLSAITLGYKNDLEAGTKNIFSQAGVMHVMALSGYNVAVIAFFLNYLLIFPKKFRHGKLARTILIIGVIWVFAFVTGLSPSVTRASVMISLVMIGTLIQRRINTINILFVSAFILLTITPGLISDIGFQLSFAAVLGIIIYQVPLYNLVSFKYFITAKIWQLFTVSVAAQLATMPLTLLYFHQFPVYFWLTNLYVVPLVSLIICVAGIFLISSFISPLMLVTGKLLAVLLDILYKGVALTDMFPYALIENIQINVLQSFILMMIILLTGFFMLQRKTIHIVMALTFIVIFQITHIMQMVSWNKQKILTVNNIKGLTSINLISGRNCYFYCDSILSQDDPKLHYTMANFWIKHGVADQIQLRRLEMPSPYSSKWMGNNIFIDFSDRHILVMKESGSYGRLTKKSPRIDVLVITGKMKSDIKTLATLFNPRIVVIDSSVNYYEAEKWIKLCREMRIKCWAVPLQGAYVLADL